MYKIGVVILLCVSQNQMGGRGMGERDGRKENELAREGGREKEEREGGKKEGGTDSKLKM